MNMDIKPNSHKYKQSQNMKTAKEKKIEKVVTGEVTKIPPKKSSIMGDFIADEASNLGVYLWRDVLVPTIKKTIVDLVSDSVNMLFYGSARQTRGTHSNTIQYSSISRSGDRFASGSSNITSKSPYRYDSIIFKSSDDANEVLDRMEEIIDTYGAVSVGDLYDLAGMTGDYTANKYGWTSLRSAEPVRVQSGYILKLPRVTPL